MSYFSLSFGFSRNRKFFSVVKCLLVAAVAIAPIVVLAQEHDVVQLLKRNATVFAVDGNHGAANRQDVYLWNEDENNINQQWYEIERGGGYYSYQKVDTEYCLDGGNGAAVGQNVYLWACRDNNQNQHWLKVDAGNGHFQLVKRNAPDFSIDGGNGGARRQSLTLASSNNSNQDLQWFFNVVTQGSNNQLASANNTDAVETDEEAANFLLQATFGPTEQSIAELRSLGYSDWFKKQIDTDIDWYIDDAQRAEANSVSNMDRGRFTFNFWMEKAVYGQDQLRQRAVFALSEIIPSATNQEPLWRKTQLHATFKDHFQVRAFGNYRDLLEDVTYSPLMGNWLTYAGNMKANPVTGSQPDENYAREILQLFSIGLVELNNDGTVKTNNGEPIETYTQADIVELAKIFTGLYWAGARFGAYPGQHTRLPQDTLPMEMHNEFHSEGAKTFLGQTVPEFDDGNRSISSALDIIFNHSNVAPFIASQLIQRFTTSDPSSGYVSRVATTFNDGTYILPDGSRVGNGERGHLVPVLAAVLFDQEARGSNRFNNNNFGRSWGKIREPIIRLMHWMRVAKVTLSLIHISEPTRPRLSRMPSSA